MANDDATVSDGRRNLAQALCHMLVGQTVEAVAPQAFRIEALPDGVVGQFE
jgi:hypothetical protein